MSDNEQEQEEFYEDIPKTASPRPGQKSGDLPKGDAAELRLMPAEPEVDQSDGFGCDEETPPQPISDNEEEQPEKLASVSNVARQPPPIAPGIAFTNSSNRVVASLPDVSQSSVGGQ